MESIVLLVKMFNACNSSSIVSAKREKRLQVICRLNWKKLGFSTPISHVITQHWAKMCKKYVNGTTRHKEKFQD